MVQFYFRTYCNWSNIISV